MSISMSSSKAWYGEIVWSYSGGYVTATMYTWKGDGLPSSAASGANFTATLTVGSTSRTFYFQQQEADRMYVGSVENVYVSDSQVIISGRVDAPYGVSLYNNPLTGSQIVTLYEEPTGTTSLITVDKPTVAIGQELKITITRASEDYTHLIRFIPESGPWCYITRDAETEYTWTVPDYMEYCGAEGLQATIECRTQCEGNDWVGESTAAVKIIRPEKTTPVCASTAAMGDTLAITLPRNYSTYTHELSYSLAGNEGSIGSGLGAACSWSIPIALAAQIPTKTAGTLYLTCKTWYGEDLIGTSEVSLTVTVPDNDTTKPSLTMALSPSSVPADGFEGLYIRYMNGVQAAFTAESAYSSVASTQLTVDGITVTGNPAVSANLISGGKVTVTGRATDVRGYSRTVTQEISVVAYDKPRVVPCTGSSKVVANRCDADGVITSSGVNLLIEAGRAYTTVQKGETQLNFCSLQYRYKVSSASDYSEWFDLLTESDTANEVKLKAEGLLPDTTAAYTVQVRAQDTLGSFSTITIPIGSLAVPFHIGKGNDNVAVGKFCDYSRKGAFEIGFTTYFDTGIALYPIFAAGSWEVGSVLSSSVTDANGALAYSHTVFLAVCEGKPVLLAKSGSYICGGDVEILYENETLTLSAAPGSVTAMYALL